MEADSRSAAAAGWDRLSRDLTELILSQLPLRSIVRAGAVCRQWRAVVTHPSFPARAAASRRRRPWFFLLGHNNVVLRLNRAYGFDPDTAEWVALPSSPFDCFSGCGGFCFAASSTHFGLAPLLRGAWRETRPLSFSRCNPLVGVLPGSPSPDRPRLLVVGGARFVGGLVDIEDRLAVEIYDPATDAWELCAPLPPQFRLGNSSQWLSAALVPGLFFVFGIYSCAVAAFDLGRRAWTPVRTLRPHGVLFAFLLGCGDRLVLAGVCNARYGGPPCFAVWAVDPGTMAHQLITVMPKDQLAYLFDSEDDDSRFASLKCAGLDGLIYVFNEDQHKAYPACVCEIPEDRGRPPTWRKVPPVPGPLSRFHKMIAFCSPVLMHSVLAAADDDGGGAHRQ